MKILLIMYKLSAWSILWWTKAPNHLPVVKNNEQAPITYPAWIQILKRSLRSIQSSDAAETWYPDSIAPKIRVNEIHHHMILGRCIRLPSLNFIVLYGCLHIRQSVTSLFEIANTHDSPHPSSYSLPICNWCSHDYNPTEEDKLTKRRVTLP